MTGTLHACGVLREAVTLPVGECADALAALDVRALLDEFLWGPPGALEVMATESYRHANGFDKLSFPAVDGSEARLRLHLWPAADTGGPSHPHDHRWPFVSRVLAGQVTNEISTVTDDPDGDHRRYSHRPAPGGYVFQERGRATLRPAGRFTCPQGRTYALPPEVVHRVTVPPRTRTVTLALELAPTAPGTSVFVRSGTLPTGAQVTPRCFSAAGVRERLADLRATL
ncbi:hypothetical protein [Streptacidiphilus jiangxiensis]|uniref:Cysteine dioxygenase type I n=1 Tax=Streptacidiphilus jiangxiensis TaxID=235985 RepID=A0A1H7YYT2_STRJI|nr:hypothetical protein [Streptacidiphilus jiangxiensis]SEM50389.1 hypothetical protein SAMN05414137_13123 [Streptacidiphilus jiangxiensis]